MIIVEIAKNRFAAGTLNKRADYVVALVRGKFVGVRGQRPVLTKGRFPIVKGNKELRSALTAG